MRGIRHRRSLAVAVALLLPLAAPLALAQDGDETSGEPHGGAADPNRTEPFDQDPGTDDPEEAGGAWWTSAAGAAVMLALAVIVLGLVVALVARYGRRGG